LRLHLPANIKGLYLVGDLFLRHFYSVYNFDKDQLGLGINTHSTKYAKMYAIKGNITPYKPFVYKKKQIKSLFDRFMNHTFK